MKRLGLLLGLLLLSAIPAAHESYVGATANIVSLGKIWTYFYFNNYDEFQELYQKAVASGVDNETLTEAEALMSNATEYAKEAWKTSDLTGLRKNLWVEKNVFPILSKTRKAFMYSKEALEMLKEALE